GGRPRTRTVPDKVGRCWRCRLVSNRCVSARTQSCQHREEGEAGAECDFRIASRQLAEVEQGLAAVILKKLLLKQITGIIATAGIRRRLRIRVVVRLEDLSKIVEEVPILERLRIGVWFEPHMRRLACAPRLQVSDIIRTIQEKERLAKG